MSNYGPEAIPLSEVIQIIERVIADTVDLDQFDRAILADAIAAALNARDLLDEHPTK